MPLANEPNLVADLTPRVMSYFQVAERDTLSPERLIEHLSIGVTAIEQGAEDGEVAVDWETFSFSLMPGRAGFDTERFALLKFEAALL